MCTFVPVFMRCFCLCGYGTGGLGGLEGGSEEILTYPIRKNAAQLL